MEPSYSEWKPVIDANNHYITGYCPYCGDDSARMMKRYYTNRDGESEAQFRVECPVCKNHGKTYLHESIAQISWDGQEHDPNREKPFAKKRLFGHLIRYNE